MGRPRRPIVGGIIIGVTGTVYKLNVRECDGDPFQPAWSSFKYTKEKAQSFKYIAVSRDLLWYNDGPFRYGDTVQVSGGGEPFDGIKTVVDTMSSRFKKRIDICIPNDYKPTRAFGLTLRKIE